MKIKLIFLLCFATAQAWAQGIVFSNFTEMRGRKGAQDGVTVTLNGGNTAGDAAKGQWSWNASLTTADNGVNIIGSWPVGRWVKSPSGDNDASKLQNVAPVSAIPQLPASKVTQDANNQMVTAVDKAKIPLIDGKVDKVNGKVLTTNDYTDSDKTKVSQIDQIAQDKAESTVKRVPFDNVRERLTINSDGDSTAVPRETYYSTVGRVDTTKRGLNVRIDSMKAALTSGPVQRISREYVLASHNFVSAATGGFATATSSGSVSTYGQGMPVGRLAISTGSSSASGSAFLGGSTNTLTIGTSVRHAWEVVYTVPTFSDTTNTFQEGIGFDQGTSDLVHFLGLEVQNATVRGVSRRSGTEQGTTPTVTLQSVNTRYRARVQIVYNSSTTNYDVKFYFKQQVGFTPVTEYPWTESDVIFTRSLAAGQIPAGPLAPCVITRKSKGTSGAGQINIEQVIYSYIFP